MYREPPFRRLICEDEPLQNHRWTTTSIYDRVEVLEFELEVGAAQDNAESKAPDPRTVQTGSDATGQLDLELN